MIAEALFSVRRLLEPEILSDPYPRYEELREHAPVAWDDGIDSWVVTGFTETAAVLRDTGSFCSDWRRIGEETPDSMLSIQSLDPPEHTAVRRLMLDAFRAADNQAAQRKSAEFVHDLLAKLASRDSFDFVTEFAEPVALRTITLLLGAPEPELSWFAPVSHAVVDAMDASLRPECYEPGLRARAELAELTGRWLAARPRSGLLAQVASHAGSAGTSGEISPDVLHNSLRAVLHAGFESASRFLSAALLALLDAPDGLRAAAREPAAAAELARYAGPVQADSRGCVRDTVLGDQAVCRGQVVTMLLGAANRDPRAFSGPGSLRLSRSPNHHLAFGRGAHACLGSALAQQLAEVVFGALGRDYPGTSATGSPVFRPNATLRGLLRLDVTLRED